MKKAEPILKEVLKRVEPPEEDLDYITKHVSDFTKTLEKILKKRKINAEIFIGGSYAKKTLIKKDSYDIDIFLRFDKSYEDKKLSELTGDVLSDMTNFRIIHGSRDYFKIEIKDNFFIEVVPVRKVNNPKESENITDLSYSHVKYINKKIKAKEILKNIKIAKAFCHANECYGAESYINGFSGYSLELLIYYFGDFLNFIKAMSRIGREKEIIDIEKKYKRKKDVLIDMNSSKLNSPIILVDPTYPQRNTLAALSKETFKRFQEVCREFLKSPSIKFFEKKKINKEEIKKQVLKDKNELIFLEISTLKQSGDVAGSKLFKFYKHLLEETNKYFIIKDKGFEYNGDKKSIIFLICKKRDFILQGGPFLNDLKNVQKFIKEHKEVFKKNKRMYAKEKINFSIKEFFEKWKMKNSRRIKEMYINGIKVV